MDSSPSQSPTSHVEAMSSYTCSPLLEKLGLAETYQSRMRNPPTRTPGPSAPTLNASKNELSDAALAVVAGQTNAPIMSGVKGASIDRVEQNGFSIYISQAKFEIPTDMSVFASSRHEISNNTRPRDQAGVALPPVDGTDTTSVMGSKVATEKEVSLTITETTPSSHAQGTLTSSATVIKLAERQTMPPPPTIEEYPAAFRDMTDGTTIAYTEALTLLRKYNPSSKLREHRKPLQIQKQVILYRSREIQNVLSKSAGNNMRSNELLKAACDRIHKRLSELQDWLRLLPSYVGSKPCDDGQDEKIRIRALPKMLNSWYEQLLGAFKNYEKATDELINRQIRPLQSDNSLQKLSTDARASSRLRQCLCHVCPEGCHTFHTAFLSLEPENLNAVIDSSASKSPSTEVNPETMWQCHMAFKSTVTKKDSLIWLKVVSNVTVNHPPSTMTSNISTSLDAPQKRDKESLSPESEGATPHVSSRKRRASSTPPEPAFKTPKTRPGQPHRHSDLAVRISSSIELCPEFLTQHDTTEHAVMKIVDNGGCGHNIYYLAQEERLAYGVRYMTLDKLLKNRRSHRYCTALTSLFSRLRLARLIAEAVLRFDLRDSDPAPDKNIYVHGLGSKGAGAGGGYLSLVNGHNLPALFLAIRLEKQEHSFLGAPSVGFLGSENMGGSNETAGRENVLVNLGTILLRIGVESDDKLQLNQAPMGLDWGRRFISENAAETEIGNAYANVVRNCARFFEDNEFMTDELFRDKFFSTIVLPLKHCEKSILPKRG